MKRFLLATVSLEICVYIRSSSSRERGREREREREREGEEEEEEEEEEEKRGVIFCIYTCVYDVSVDSM